MKSLVILLVLFTTLIFGQSIELRNEQNTYDYVIITIDEFTSECQRFAEHKSSYNDFSVLVTTKNNILSEFNSKIIISDNIRDFISYAGNNWQTPRPKYFLFAADLDSIPNFSFRSVDLPEFTDSSYSDYYYGVNNMSLDSTQLSFSIGRIPARNVAELMNYFDKVISYELNPLEEWNKNALFISDDGYVPNGNDGDIHFQIAYDLSNKTPDQLNKYYITAIDTSEYFGDTESIIEMINAGQSALFFSGHGYNEVFTHESLFVASDVEFIENNGKPFFVSIMGGQHYSKSGNSSIVNEMILSDKGALASINSVGNHFVSAGSNFYESVWNKLYSNISIGEILVEAINNSASYTENRKFNIFGDPSIILKIEEPVAVQNNNIALPAEFVLKQNYPNPFNPSTKIKYTIPVELKSKKAKLKSVTLIIFDLLGREITTLVNEKQSPGNYEVTWNVNSGNVKVPSGIYFYTLSVENFVQTKKMILLK